MDQIEKKIVFGVDLTGANPALFAALAKAQGAMTGAKKGSVNSHFRNQYADLASVLEAILPPMNAEGLALLQFPGDDDGPRVTVTTLITHADGGFIASIAACRADKDTAQGYGSAVSYLKRYSCQAALACPSTEDDDGNAATGTPKIGAKAPRPAPQPRATRPAQAEAKQQHPAPPRAAGASYPDPPPEGRACPECDGRMWDNRENKRNPKGPDFKCKDRDCGKAIWLPKPAKAPSPSGNGAADENGLF
jgi:hypothetical protein